MRAIDADLLEPTEMLVPMGNGNYECTRIVYMDDIDNMPTIEPQQKWIPCSERMPEAGQKCLVCEKGTIAIDTYIGNGKPYDWRWYMRDYDAWMPLPEPWRGEEHEQSRE